MLHTNSYSEYQTLSPGALKAFFVDLPSLSMLGCSQHLCKILISIILKRHQRLVYRGHLRAPVEKSIFQKGVRALLLLREGQDEVRWEGCLSSGR